MPCDTIQTNTVTLENVKDHELLERGLRAEFGQVTKLGPERYVFTVDGSSVTVANGRATSRLDNERLGAVVGRVKQAYAREIVFQQAKRFGWTIKKGKDANNFQIVKG